MLIHQHLLPGGRLLVTINRRIRSTMSRGFATKHSASPPLDNCHSSYAQQNARELADLLTSGNAPVVMPKTPGTGEHSVPRPS